MTVQIQRYESSMQIDTAADPHRNPCHQPAGAGQTLPPISTSTSQPDLSSSRLPDGRRGETKASELLESSRASNVDLYMRTLRRDMQLTASLPQFRPVNPQVVFAAAKGDVPAAALRDISAVIKAAREELQAKQGRAASWQQKVASQKVEKEKSAPLLTPRKEPAHGASSRWKATKVVSIANNRMSKPKLADQAPKHWASLPPVRTACDKFDETYRTSCACAEKVFYGVDSLSTGTDEEKADAFRDQLNRLRWTKYITPPTADEGAMLEGRRAGRVRQDKGARVHQRSGDHRGYTSGSNKSTRDQGNQGDAGGNGDEDATSNKVGDARWTEGSSIRKGGRQQFDKGDQGDAGGQERRGRQHFEEFWRSRKVWACSKDCFDNDNVRKLRFSCDWKKCLVLGISAVIMKMDDDGDLDEDGDGIP